jgi:phosphatidylglycerophosphatase C
VRIALFDLDGTITRHDTLLPYVTGLLARRPWQLVRLLGALPASIAFLLRLADHGQVKSALMKATLRGRTRAELDAWTRDFAPRLISRGTFPRALARIDEHRRAGDRLVLMSASPDLYVPALGRALGFDEVIATGVRWNGDRFDGALTTPNRRGEEKVRCLQALRDRHPGVPIVAYGNGSADLAHLARVDEALLVNARPAVRRRAAELGIPQEDWGPGLQPKA